MSEKTERWLEVDRVFSEALDLEPEERGVFLDAECAGDAELRAAVERLLAATAEDDPLLRTGGGLAAITGEAPSFAGGSVVAVPERFRVGPFQVLAEIGRGGMAVVYLAKRVDGQFDQQVALKLLKRPSRDGELVRRFAQERQILATLQHPHIARLLDGGVAEDGRPYFAMEYVDGRPIDRYCDEEKLSLPARLRLFVDVARAVESAHRNLVIHRDLKPSNILVDSGGSVKLLDFGIAKLLEPSSSESVLTRSAVRPMTPEYASPEQIRGEPMTTASDVYQLGLLLYELLTGVPPYRVEGTSPLAWARVICEQEPPRPSSVAATARRRKQLAGDLDIIVLKALRKEPDQRYFSAGELIDDVERHLQGRPVRARKDTLGYRTRKFAGRHRTALVSAVAVFLTGAGMVVYYTEKLARERDRAEVEALRAQRVSELLVQIFRGSDPYRSPDPDVTARELLDRGAVCIESELAAEPETQASMMALVGDVYRHLGLYDRARPLLEGALSREESLLGREHPKLAATLEANGLLLKEVRAYREAIVLFERALAIRQAALGPEHPLVGETLHHLAIVTRYGRSAELARPHLERALAILEKSLGPDHRSLARALSSYGLLLRELEDPAGSRRAFERALAMRERLLGAHHPELADSLSNLALLEKDEGNFAKARGLWERAIAIEEAALGPEHPQLAPTLAGYADLLHRKLGERERALPIYERIVEIRSKKLGPEHSLVGQGLHDLTRLMVEMGRYEAALPLMHRALEITRKEYKPEHWVTINLLFGLGESLTRLGRYAEAEPYLLEAWGLFEKSEHFEAVKAPAAQLVVALYEAWGKKGEAERWRGFLKARPERS